MLPCKRNISQVSKAWSIVHVAVTALTFVQVQSLMQIPSNVKHCRDCIAVSISDFFFLNNLKFKYVKFSESIFNKKCKYYKLQRQNTFHVPLKKKKIK